MTYAAGALSKVLVGQTTANLSSAAASGGVSPYTYQWYRSTTNGFTPGAGNILSGQTGLTLADSGLIGGTTYYYEVQSADVGNAGAIASSAQLSVSTQPVVSQNQFAQSPVVGVVDMKVGSTNVLAAQVDTSVSTQIYAGQAVKVVANTVGGIPRVAPISSKADQIIGFAVFNFKDLQYTAGQNLEIALWGSVVWLYATGAVSQFAEVCADPTFIGGVQATGATATIVGTAIDGASAAGMIRVLLVPNAAYATA